MVVLGLLLVLAAAGAIAFVSVNASTTSDATFSAFGYSVAANHLEMFLAGAAVAAVLLVGIAMLNSGTRRAAERRRRLRAVRHEARDKVAQLEAEKRELERKLEEEHTAHADTRADVPAQRTAVQPTDRLVHRDTREDSRT
ncbi:hypothetical protein [Thermoactinospora rubra]|uniref:hypothetical protein n=1 Tax=Thermoactinospora rubra TaxID=1088767 RepID=UPI00117FD5B9|nr:hypothetical protein [Thermoactinospora rubra]